MKIGVSGANGRIAPLSVVSEIGHDIVRVPIPTRSTTGPAATGPAKSGIPAILILLVKVPAMDVNLAQVMVWLL